MADPRINRNIHVLARALGRLGREHARAVGNVTPQQAEALQLIADQNVMSTSTLATLLGIDPSTASRNLAGLERGGLIARRQGAQDGRQTDVRLTARGKRVAEAVSQEWSKACSTLLESIPRGERQRVVDALDALARTLDGQGPR
jgi:DNA-binding MarR family transcriptional regulator